MNINALLEEVNTEVFEAECVRIAGDKEDQIDDELLAIAGDINDEDELEMDDHDEDLISDDDLAGLE